MFSFGIAEKDKLNAIISLSDLSFLPDFFQQVRSVSPTLGIMYTSFHNVNYPTSLGISGSAYYYHFNYYYSDVTFLNFYFAQALSATKNIYPVFGISYSLPLQSYENYTQGKGSFEFHVGLNIKLLKPERKEVVNN